MTSKFYRQGGLVAAVMALALAASPAQAVLVQPMVIRMYTAGQGANAAITVVNDKNKPDTIQVKVSRLIIGETGSPQTEPVKSDDFLIFPPIATIEAGKTQVFRLRWVGEPKLDKAGLYMVTSQEVPVDQQGTGVQVVYAIQTLVAVSTPGMTSAPELVSQTATERDVPESPQGPAHHEAGLDLLIQNTGNNALFLVDYGLRLQGDNGFKQDLSTVDVEHAVGLGLIPANARRHMFIPVKDLPKTGQITVTFRKDGKG
ncbi:fimbria/pilus periplasmic chaperone [Novosphingobium terrae]|uniref:fimbria/pilus periplasmic chaperone n=1 Tax=Novosphingobium terrae TaxID=2726189 RepID=UPI00197E8337|nr:fimbria/pilus periplasmic chaperone [Novosphingobium terrae]